MARRSSSIGTVVRSAPRAVYYPDPAVRPEVVYYSEAQLARKRREQQQMYMQWKARQIALVERERRFRRFCLGFGAIVATALLAVFAVVGWWVWHAVTSMTFAAGPVLLALVVLAVGAKVGHRCVTIVQHWH